MVQNRNTIDGDGIERHVQYAKWRTDKPADEGYSRELVHVDVTQDCYDDFEKLPELQGAAQSILEVFLNQVRDRPNNKFLGTRRKLQDGSYGEYEWQTFKEVFEKYEAIAKGCKELRLLETVEGINEDGKEWAFCGIWSKNRWEWHTTMLSSMVCKATVIGFYDSMGDASVEYCFNQTKLQTMFVTAEYLEKILEMRASGQAQLIQNIVMFDTDEESQALIQRAQNEFQIRVLTLDEVCEAGRQSNQVLQPELLARDDIYMLNYTSGTTGASKGVKISHWGTISSSLIYSKTYGFTENDVIIDYLPAPHAYDQFMWVSMLIAGGSQGYWQGNPQKLMEDLQELKPTLFPSVPRLLNRIYAKIKADFDSTTGFQKWLLDRALASKQYNLTEKQTASYTNRFYDWCFFAKTTELLGGRIRMMFSAAAPISKDVLELLKIAFCCPVQELYGLSETSGGITATLPLDPISGTVGGPYKHIAVRIKDLPDMNYRITDKPFPRGEICIRSPCVVSGYFMQPDKTAEAIDEQGWLHTGDVGIVYPNGTIRILDRCKNIFKLSQGEYVAPEKVENILIQSNYIAQCLVHGDSIRDCTVGIIVPEMSMLQEWATKAGKDWQQVLADQDAEFIKLIMDEIKSLSALRHLNRLEQPRAIYIATDPFSVENDILTPTFKLKRNIGAQVYKAELDALYVELAKTAY